MFNCTLELDQRSYIWLEANEKSDVNTKLKYFAKSVLWDDASPIFFNISRPEPVYANALDVCVWIEKNPSIFETFNRLKRIIGERQVFILEYLVFSVYLVFFHFSIYIWEESEYFRDV